MNSYPHECLNFLNWYVTGRFSSNSLAHRITHNNDIIITPDGDCKKKEAFLPYLTFL